MVFGWCLCRPQSRDPAALCSVVWKYCLLKGCASRKVLRSYWSLEPLLLLQLQETVDWGGCKCKCQRKPIVCVRLVVEIEMW
jgi:hypothetical protein